MTIINMYLRFGSYYGFITGGIYSKLLKDKYGKEMKTEDKMKGIFIRTLISMVYSPLIISQDIKVLNIKKNRLGNVSIIPFDKNYKL